LALDPIRGGSVHGEIEETEEDRNGFIEEEETEFDDDLLIGEGDKE
jgi:hypothetical protein